LALAAGLAYAAWSYERSENVRRPPVLGVDPPGAPIRRGPATRVVWVMIDGLRLDASRRMATLDRLRVQGEDVAGRAEFPTFSRPNFVAQASGIEPVGSGAVSNGDLGEVALDSVFRRAKLAGLRTAVVTTDFDRGIAETYGSWVDDAIVHDPGVSLPPADLVFAHVGFVDRAGHEFGAASPGYRAAVVRADAVIACIARSLDPTRDALVVSSDHGHLDAGGHGGTERDVVRIPIVVWGAGVVRGSRIGRGRDVGPTIASLLGIGPLAHATGRPLVHGDVRAARQRDAVRAAVDATRPGHDRLPPAVPLVALALLVLGVTCDVEPRSIASAPTYALVFAVLVLATDTVSFSVSNDSTLFGARLVALCMLAGLAQLRVGGRSSLVPAAVVAAVLALTALAAAHRPGASMRGMLWFLPIPALAGLAFICFMSGLAGRRYAVGRRPREPLRSAGPASFETDVVVVAEPRLGGPAVVGSRCS
jgi:hypothetical protein